MALRPAKPPDARAEPDPDFERIRRILVGCVRRACPPDLVPLVDDIVQVAITRLVAQVRRADESLDFGTPYLWRVANHAVIDEIRRRTPRREESMADTEAITDAAPDPERRLAGQRIAAGVSECLAEASEDRRAALNLYLQGLKVPEISRAPRLETASAPRIWCTAA